MYITVHAAAGAAVGTLTGNPLLAFIGGFVSHLILDMIPHGDETIKKWKLFKTIRARVTAAALLDFAGVILALLFLLNNASMAFLPGMLAGMARVGHDPAPLLAAAGIAPPSRTDPAARVPIAAYAELYNRVARALDDEAFGLFSTPMRGGSFELLARALVSAPPLARRPATRPRQGDLFAS